MISVLLIEDHVLIRRGMRLMLEQIKGIRIVGEASTGEEGLALRREKEPGVVILDFQLPDTNGLELARRLLRRDPEIKILVVTAMEGELLPMRLLEVGVRGFITKSSDSAELERAIRAVHSGQRYIGSAIASRLALSKTTAAKSPFDQLSNRQIEVLLLLAKGMNAESIAKQLHITAKTVNSHRYRMFEKLGVKNDVELIKLAVQYGLIDIDKTTSAV
ncbi:response regulator [Coxiella burnetii]|uniref:response regulator n=1 Tax=Coxiella burnetii TaxID=777 RepID=UPI0000ECFE8C|nr:response regulator [Coxiella burnetii]ACJ20118.1 response regulator [Coxiella burnetii CbuK_Q154]EAX32256.1 two-component system response regulator UvrY [Coxiella burnetii 'MSU Goat Q177']UYK70539.1 response regulator [Coxiella burnetii]